MVLILKYIKFARTITISGNVVETITGTRELTIGNTNKS